MNLTIVGASGFIGSKILNEAVARGHHVTALCRHPENLQQHVHVRAVAADVGDTAALTREFRGADAVIHSYAPPPDPVVRAFIMDALSRNDPGAIGRYTPADPAGHDAHVQSRIDAQTPERAALWKPLKLLV